MSYQITKDDIKTIAQLARLGLSDQEVAQATTDLVKILDHFSMIQTIDTQAVASFDNATGLTNITRPDEAHSEDHCSCQDLLDLAPATQDQHIKVPAVFN